MIFSLVGAPRRQGSACYEPSLSYNEGMMESCLSSRFDGHGGVYAMIRVFDPILGRVGVSYEDQEYGSKVWTKGLEEEEKIGASPDTTGRSRLLMLISRSGRLRFLLQV